jgi:PAS domain S-box-containing protein
MDKGGQKSAASILREKALALLNTKPVEIISEVSKEEIQEIIHELEVHQIELEMQYEELQNARSETEKTLEKYTELFDFGPSGYFTLSKEGEIQELNLYGANLLGKTRSELIFRRFVFFIVDEERELFNHFLDAVFDHHVKQSCELTLSIKQNEVIYVMISGIAIENSEQCFLNVVDITKLKRTEDDLKAANIDLALQNKEKELRTVELIKTSKKAEESDRLKTAFLANMSHEIRTPLNGIMGFAELLKKILRADEAGLKYIDIIEKSGKRLLNIINDLIEISKIESGVAKVKISPCNISEQLEFTFSLFKPEAEKKGLKFFLHLGLAENEAIINSDCEKIYAVLFNLIKNAITYTDSGWIDLGCDIQFEGEQKELFFYVKDTGIGIAPENQRKNFERFSQIDDDHLKYCEGAGLGLALVKAYVQMLGGTYGLESEQDKGSTFYFTLPFNNITEEMTLMDDSDMQSEIVALNKKLKILIVEDDENSEMLLTLILQKEAKELLYATTGIEAIGMFREISDIDLILMDIRMTGMSGIEATKVIRQFNKEVIIIAETAYAYENDKSKAIEAGCNDYIEKPITRKMLIDVINKYF